MVNYQEILEKSQRELAEVKQQEAVINSKIKELTVELGLDDSKDLLPQIERLRAETEERIHQSNAKIAGLLDELKTLENKDNAHGFLNLKPLVEQARFNYNSLLKRRDYLSNEINVAQLKMNEILVEQDLIERSLFAIQAAKPLLSASSIKQCEELANSAISSVFDLPYTVEYNVETKKFNLNKGTYVTELSEDGEGGGMLVVISFVFTVYLLVKLNKRRFLAFDEAFTQISDKYFPAFLSFMNQLCKDLQVDILWISHDVRVSVEDVDHAFLIENGVSKRLK